MRLGSKFAPDGRALAAAGSARLPENRMGEGQVRLFDVAGMRRTIGVEEARRHDLRCRAAASWGCLKVSELCHNVFRELMVDAPNDTAQQRPPLE